jgi:hypothetical protein
MPTPALLRHPLLFADEAVGPVAGELRPQRQSCAAKFPGAEAPEAGVAVRANNNCVRGMGRLGRPLVVGGRELRRADSIDEAARLRVRGLESAASHALTDPDGPEKTPTMTGEELVRRGIPVADCPAAVVLAYKKK